MSTQSRLRSTACSTTPLPASVSVRRRRRAPLASRGSGRPPPTPTSTPRRRGVADERRRVGVNLLWLLPGVGGGSEEYTPRLLRGVGGGEPHGNDPGPLPN